MKIKMKMKSKGNRKNKQIIAAIIIIIIMIMPFAISYYVVNSTENLIVGEVNSNESCLETGLQGDLGAKGQKKGVDCILILGAGLKPDGTPNHMLQDRLDVGIELYKQRVAPKILLSGDNGQEQYDEVNAMKKYAIDEGVPLEDIFMDHAGFSTYESMYRAKEIFNVKKAVVVTQKYHQHRALYIGGKLGMDCYGVTSDQRTYVGQGMRELREILARNKDFAKMIYKPSPTYLGEAIPISGNGIESHD